MRRWNTNRRIVIILAVAVLLTSLGAIGQLGPVRWVYDSLLAPITSAVAGVGTTTGEALGNVSRVKDLGRENQRLTSENAALRQRLAADAETRRDNELLRRQLGLEVAGGPKQTAAEVVSAEPNSFRQFITINKGQRAGITTGQAVMSEGMLVGLVDRALPTSARVMLVTDPGFRLTAKDQDTGATGIISGQLGGGLTMDKIGQTDAIRPGETITTSGLGSKVPAGLYIGRVQSVDTRRNAVFQSASISTNLRMSSLRFVYVVQLP